MLKCFSATISRDNVLFNFNYSTKCSYLITFLLFKYSTACVNVCPGPHGCNKKNSLQFQLQDNLINQQKEFLAKQFGILNQEKINLNFNEKSSALVSNQPSLSIHKEVHTSSANINQQPSQSVVKNPPFERNPLHCQHCSGVKQLLTMKNGPFSPGDPSSFSRPEIASVDHVDLFLDVNFEEKILSGEVHYLVNIAQPNATVLTLDAHNLTIFDVLDKATGNPLNYSMGEHVENFGSKMEITLPKNSSPESKVNIIIKYKTSPSCSALQWLAPEHTAGKTKPYMFSQCQPIHCRSMLPIQDTPSVKQTYSAQITAPKDLTVLMSAIKSNEIGNYFYQNVKVPSYLIAIVVGNLASVRLSERVAVWSEPEVVDKAAYEFDETEVFLKTAEDICGAYVWGVYDLVMLPPSFPFGGMENPCLTFVTPTLLAGDRSLASVVAHEISHSWTGNLVTNRNFEHFWLNEGFTMFIERKILGRIKGERERHFDAIAGLKDLKQSLNNLGESNPLTRLIVDLKQTHPDDAFSTCPYEKGHTFLFYLEQVLGGPDVFEPWLKKYLQDFSFQSIDTDAFKKHLTEHFSQNEKLKEIDWDLWLHTPGMPPIIPKYDTSLQDACVNLANKWINWDPATNNASNVFSQQDLSSFSPHQKQEFLAILLDKEMFDLDKVKSLEKVYNLNEVQNCEIKFRWLKLSLKAKWKDQVPYVVQMITSQGRMKYVRPLYRALYAWEETKSTAVETFEKNKKNMMYVSAYTVAKDLNVRL